MQGKKKNKVRVATDRWSRYVRQKKEGISWGQICLGISGYIWVCLGISGYLVVVSGCMGIYRIAVGQYGHGEKTKKNGFTRVRSGDPHHVKMM